MREAQDRSFRVSCTFVVLAVASGLAGCGSSTDSAGHSPIGIDLAKGRFAWETTTDCSDATRLTPSAAEKLLEARAAGRAQPSYAPASPEALAKALRPIMIRGRDVYLGPEPDVRKPEQSTHARLSGDSSPPRNQPVTQRLLDPTTLETASVASARVRADAVTENVGEIRSNLTLLTGLDNRRLVRGTTTLPWSAQLFVSTTLVGCSGTMIGPNTGITAAHCFFNGTYHGISAVVPGIDNRAAVTDPFSWYGPECVAAMIPDGWRQDPSNRFWDFAVLDFSACGARVGDTTGWLGWDFTGQVQTTALSTFGYPDTCPGIFLYPQLCGMTVPVGSVTSGPSPGLIQDQAFDFSSGASGSGIWSTGNRLVMGIVSGSLGNVRLNRVLDSTVLAFLQAVSNDF